MPIIKTTPQTLEKFSVGPQITLLDTLSQIEKNGEGSKVSCDDVHCLKSYLLLTRFIAPLAAHIVSRMK